MHTLADGSQLEPDVLTETKLIESHRVIEFTGFLLFILYIVFP